MPDALDRIHRIIELLTAHPEGLTIGELARGCQVEPKVIKKDIEKMELEHRLFPLWSDQDSISGADVSDMRSGSEEIDWQEKEGPDAAFGPQARWCINPDYQQLYPVYFNTEDFINLASLLSLLRNSDSVSSVLLRQVGDFLSEEFDQQQGVVYTRENPIPYLLDEQMTAAIQQAIKMGKRIKFTYRDYRVEAAPLGLVYYSRLRRWYIVAEHENYVKNYYVGNVSDITITSKPFAFPRGFSVEAWLKTRWGTEYGEPFKVKIRFADQAQTIPKVRKDVAHRSCQLTPGDDGSLLYEDVIIGRNEFMTWLLGFGAAAEILEPVELRRDMLQIIKQTLAQYKEDYCGKQCYKV